jgi:hypothetical protein
MDSFFHVCNVSNRPRTGIILLSNNGGRKTEESASFFISNNALYFPSLSFSFPFFPLLPHILHYARSTSFLLSFRFPLSPSFSFPSFNNKKTGMFRSRVQPPRNHSLLLIRETRSRQRSLETIRAMTPKNKERNPS